MSGSRRTSHPLRQASATDLPAVLHLHRQAFPAGEGERITQVVEELWRASIAGTHPVHHWVITTTQQAIVGHVCLSSITTEAERMVGWILAPLAVASGHQGQGLGSALVQQAIGHAMDSDQPRILVYGDPAYYRRFGFDHQPAVAFKPPYPLSQPMGWQCLVANGKTLHDSVDIRCHPALMHVDLW